MNDRMIDHAVAVKNSLLGHMQAVANRPKPPDDAFEYFEDYVDAWIEDGEAIVVTGGDHGLCLRGFILAIDAWLKDPSVINYEGDSIEGYKPFERKLKGLLRPGHVYHDYLAPAAFNRQLILMLAGKRDFDY